MKTKMSLALSALLLTVGAYAIDGDGEALVFTDPEVLSSGGTIVAGNSAFKTKLVRLGNGRLISTWGEGIGPEVYDLKGDNVRKARDIFVRSCMPTDDNEQCAHQADWTEAVNVSNTAYLASMETKWRETPEGELDPTPAAFFGDSGKPNIFNSGSFAVISWTDKYCPSGEQRMVSYNERGGITMPFSCVYTARVDYAGVTDAEPVWTRERLTTGIRDAMQDVNKGLSINGLARWILTWQEDPHGLQVGGGDGPGEGASGANVTHGTDIWYTFTWNAMGKGFNNAPVRISNNYTNDGAGGNTSPVYSPADPDTAIEILERGNTGASRANTAFVALPDDPLNPRTVIAYEETKGADRLDSGKFVRYHTFPWNQPPASRGQYLNGAAGAIISDPAENSRRVRFVTQVMPSAEGLKMGIFWRQGNDVEGGPGDIMVRLGFKPAGSAAWDSGLLTKNMVPAVDPAANTDYAGSLLINNVAATNISSNTIPWSAASCPINDEDPDPTNNLDDATDLNNYEDARAHRAAIRGDDFYIGYTYAKDWAVATYTDQDNYNFWFRRYSSPDNNWTVASNISKIPRSAKLAVKEPRLVGMPGSMPGCDPDALVEDEKCQNKDAVLLGWGTVTNVYAHIGGAIEGDIVYTISKDKGETYLPLATVPGYPDPDDHSVSRFESQLRSTPAGNMVYSVWNEDNSIADASYSGLSISDNRVPAPIPAP